MSELEELKGIKDAAKQLINVTVARQHDCEGYHRMRCVELGATHKDLIDDVNAAVDDLYDRLMGYGERYPISEPDQPTKSAT